LTLSVVGVAAVGTLTGCAVAPSASLNCSLKVGVLPAMATADHMAATPGNQQAFNVGFVGPFPAGCAVPAFVNNPQNFTWVSSDPVNAPISNAKDATAGVDTCVGTTTVPATISTSPAGSIEAATLTCK
jgi:hypothetical protein